MPLVQPSAGTAPTMPDGLYTLEIQSAVQGTRENFDDKSIIEPFLRVNVLVVDVRDEEGEPIILRTDMTLKWSNGGASGNASTLYLYANAFGVSPGPDSPFNTDLLEGRRALGMVKTPPDGGWPRIVRDSLMPVKAVKGQPVGIDTAELNRRMDRQKAQEAPPWEEDDALVVAEALAQWFESLISLNLKRDDIIDAALDVFGKPPKNLTAAEREQLAKSLRV